MKSLAARPCKTCRVPGAGLFDITKVLPLTQEPLFKKMGRRAQLGGADAVFVGAKHSREHHSLVAAAFTVERCQNLLRAGMITEQDLADLVVNALVHDIGHGPKSHLTDPLVAVGHNQRAIALLRLLKSVIEECGSSLERQISLAERSDPLYQITMNTPLGCEKLAYMVLDAMYTEVMGVPDVGPFLSHVYYLDGQLVADIKLRNEVSLLIESYRRMYAEVYFRRSVLRIERYLQSMISRLLGQCGDEPEVSEEDLVQMTDGSLDHALEHARNPEVRAMWERLESGRAPKHAVTFHVAPFHAQQWWGVRPVTSLEAPESLFANESLRRPSVLHALERSIEESVGLASGTVLVAPPVDPQRFSAPNVRFLVGNDRIIGLDEVMPGRREQMARDALQYAGLFVCVDPEHRPYLGRPDVAAQVAEVVMQYA